MMQTKFKSNGSNKSIAIMVSIPFLIWKLVLNGFFLEFRDELCGNIVDIFESLQTLRLSLFESSDTDQFKNS